MPLFSDTIDHGSTNGRYHACGIHRALSVTVDRNENPTQKSITRARYDVCLTRVDCQRAWAFSARWYGWLFMSRAVHVTVVSRTLNWTRENLKTKNPARGLRRRGCLVKYSLISFNPRTCDKYDYYFDPRRQHSAECDDLKT